MPVKHMDLHGQSLPLAPYAVSPPEPLPHSVSKLHWATAIAYPPTRFGPQKDVCPGVMASQSRSVGDAVGGGVEGDDDGGAEDEGARLGGEVGSVVGSFGDVVGVDVGSVVGDPVVGFAVGGGGGFAVGGGVGFPVGGAVAATMVTTPPPHAQHFLIAGPIPPLLAAPPSASQTSAVE